MLQAVSTTVLCFAAATKQGTIMMSTTTSRQWQYLILLRIQQTSATKNKFNSFQFSKTLILLSHLLLFLSVKNGKLSFLAQSVILNAVLDCIRPYWFLLFCASLLELYIFQRVPKRQPPCYTVVDNWSSTSARIASQIKTDSPFFCNPNVSFH